MDRIDYNQIATSYAKNRSASPQVIAHILEHLEAVPCPAILEVGCGTADHLASLTLEHPWTGTGFDQSLGMLGEARRKHPGLLLTAADAQVGYPFQAGVFGLAFSMNVIHYIRDLPPYFGEMRRVLQAGGLALTVTDSEEDIRGRAMCRYFPEIVAVELERYHRIPAIISAMRAAGFEEVWVTHTHKEFLMGATHLEAYRNQAYSALRLISEKSYQKGITALEKDVGSGQAWGNELYTYVWART